MKRAAVILLILFLLLVTYSSVEWQAQPGLNPEGYDKSKMSLHIDKSDLRLTVLYENQPLKSYPVVLGGDPVRDKRMEGDKRTPEGVFHVQDLYPHKLWSYFIWIDYPTPESWKKHQMSKAAGEIPENATIGGEIGIHGVPAFSDFLIDTRTHWTLGCISMKNRDIGELYPLVQKGTPITIDP